MSANEVIAEANRIAADAFEPTGRLTDQEIEALTNPAALTAWVKRDLVGFLTRMIMTVAAQRNDLIDASLRELRLQEQIEDMKEAHREDQRRADELAGVPG